MPGQSERPVLIIVMGTSGCGKSTFGSLLAQDLNVPFLDGDDLHPKSNVEKMSRGEALTDDDRWPWLQGIREKALQILHPVLSQDASGREKSSRDEPIKEEERIREMAEVHETSRGDGEEARESKSANEEAQEAEEEDSRRMAKGSLSKACVIACSALKKAYRDLLRGDTSTGLLVMHMYLQVDAEELHRRMRQRKGHFMKESMLQSQLATLEEPEGEPNTIIVKDDKPDNQVQKAISELQSMSLSY